MTSSNGAQNWADKKVFTTGEAAEVCKVSQQTIIRCFDSGRLTGFRVPGSKFRRIPRAELVRFMKANDIPTDLLEGGKKRLLVVDDDPAVIEVFVSLLAPRASFEVKGCGTGYDAGLLTESFRPHLIILDYLLPDINGDLVCRRLRASEHTRDTKVLFVSGAVAQNEIDRLVSAGADGFVRKPFDLDELTARIDRLLEA
ncbi:MAG TPA: response regulator [Phycisphaerales bacterium]|nr:response regulator [Phycisphaerales bacterium]